MQCPFLPLRQLLLLLLLLDQHARQWSSRYLGPWTGCCHLCHSCVALMLCLFSSSCAHALGTCPSASNGCQQGSDEAIFALATILLLLAWDPVLLPLLSETRRYAPYAAAVGCYLAASAVLQMLSGNSVRTTRHGIMRTLGDGAALLLAAPEHYLFTQASACVWLCTQRSVFQQVSAEHGF